MSTEIEQKKSEREEKYEQLYSKLSEYEQQIHLKNKHRIKIGVRCFLIIPTCFLIMLFVTGSNKIVFLILWIISLYILSFYLIGVEYGDYKLQQKLNEWGEEEKKEPETLINLDKRLDKMENNIKKAFNVRKTEVDDEEHT